MITIFFDPQIFVDLSKGTFKLRELENKMSTQNFPILMFWVILREELCRHEKSVHKPNVVDFKYPHFYPYIVYDRQITRMWILKNNKKHTKIMPFLSFPPYFCMFVQLI